MQFILILATCHLIFFQTIESKQYRVQIDDKILPHYDSSVPSYLNYFSLDNFILEQIDDDNVEIGGFLKTIKSLDRNLMLVVNVRTQYYEKATWNEGAYRLTMPNGCFEFMNPQRPWYNMTKLWTSDLCPPQEGDVLNVETNYVNIVTDVTSSVPIVPWKAFFMVSQGIPGFDAHKFGFGVQLEFIPIN